MSYPKQQYIPLPESQYPQAPIAPTTCNNDEALLNAIRMCNLDLCRNLISRDPEILHRKGWNNLTPLHQASLSGQIDIVEYFIQNGANPNARNSFEETPLHYACRRGVVSVVHLMIKNGGDSNNVDKKGRNCMHFAALAGHVVMLHYLRAHTNLNFDVPDDTGRNALHVSVEMRQFAAVCYLTKHSRVDPSLKDLRGVTPLHIAIEKGFGDIAWILLLAGGCELLSIQNQKGDSPLDISRNGSSPNHAGIYKTLECYSGSKGPPRGPVFTWYFLLLSPFIYVAVMFLLASYLNSFGGHFCFLMILVILHLMRQQLHRMNHLCRWPNPVYLGIFAGGIFHCAIAEFGYLHRMLWPCPYTIVFVTFLAGICIYLLGYLILGDPGIDKSPAVCSTTGNPMSVLDIAEGRGSDNQFSPFSEMIHDEQAKFCRLCESPMLKLDHHCLFLNNCIAKNNHRHFILLLLVVMMLQVSFVYCSARYVELIGPNVTNLGLGDPISPYLIHLYKSKPWIFFLMMLCLLSFAWEGTLVYGQFSVIMRRSTTYLTLKHKNHSHFNLSKMQMLRNLFNFFVTPYSHDQISREVVKDAKPLLHA